MSDTRIEHISEWLLSKQTALWGSGWLVTADDSREKAAQWFAQQMYEYLNWYSDNKSIVNKKKRKKG